MTHSSYDPNIDLLAIDARNRALRTFLVGLLIDVGVALVMVLTEVLNNEPNDVDWRLLPALLLKTALASAGSYVLRKYGDPSHFPTPLPPTPNGEPADHTPED